ncbi:hypothetical protein [Lysinibacter cavernae]|uniref:DNA polymerase III subunit gamma/tau n=1 Tax=Lysinibacter cavernae TaxID=1640652 RepID=A0A7X5QY84_9MICO|nr:hypothetical protein [Lysinibacter cavernae]NIH52171.1 hypothetical protein [Lysinibacter cavernae]
MVQDNTTGKEPPIDGSSLGDSSSASADADSAGEAATAQAAGGWRIVSPTPETPKGRRPQRTFDGAASAEPASVTSRTRRSPDAASASPAPDATVDDAEGNEGWVPSDPVIDVEAIAAEEAAKPRTSDVMLVIMGIMAGIYLLYTVGWYFSARDYAAYYAATGSTSGVLGDIMFQITIWLAALAPAAWFLTVFRLTMNSKPWKRVLWLAVGAIIIVPIPFLFPQVIIQ